MSYPRSGWFLDREMNIHRVIRIFSKNIWRWVYCKNFNSNNITNLWKMTFQALDGKGRHFLDLVDDKFKDIELSYIKEGLWLQSFSHSNLLCTRATRAITNHAPIGEYHLWFFPNKDFKCSCRSYSIETRRHILHECMRYNGY